MWWQSGQHHPEPLRFWLLESQPVRPRVAPQRRSGEAAVMNGYAYFNPDTGMEWRPQHPVQSGECDDAENIKVMTLAEFEIQFPKDAPDAQP